MQTACTRLLSAMASRSKLTDLYCQAVVEPILRNAAEKHKGDFGRIGIFGGSKDYTGAPYFSGAAALRVGADLVHIFCAEEAAQVIKTYSPDLIVHGVLTEKESVHDTAFFSDIGQWLPRLHTLLVGPGLGRFDSALLTARKTIEAFANGSTDNQKFKRNIVIDADGLYLLNQDVHFFREIAKNPNIRLWLTPNAIEFTRLCDAASQQLSVGNQNQPVFALADSDEQRAETLAIQLNAILIRKGFTDLIANGRSANSDRSCITAKCETAGSVRRCGGQGDLLSGSVATLATWLSLAEFECGRLEDDKQANARTNFDSLCNAAAYTACSIVRFSNLLAFQESHFSMLTSDMLRHFPAAVTQTMFISSTQ